MVRERGALETPLAFLMFGLTSLALLLLVFVALLVRHQQVVSAADLSALAAAQTSDCATAATVAARNGAELAACSVEGGRVEVRATIPSGIPARFAGLGAPKVLTATAHAVL